MAASFGTSLAGSAFFIAFTIPNLFRRLFGEGALSAAFVPQYVQTREQQSRDAAAVLARNVSSLLFCGLGLICLLLMLLCAGLLFGGFLPPRAATVAIPLLVMLPYLVWICLAALAMGVLNAENRFVLPAFVPCILNLIWIGLLWVLQSFTELLPEQKTYLLAWGILLAGILQFTVQLPLIRKIGIRSSERVTPLSSGVRKVLFLMAPAALGAAVTQVNVLLDRVLALWAGDYGTAALSYAERLIYLPLGLFATALGTILLPRFSTLKQIEDRSELNLTLNHGLRMMLFIMLPASIGLALLSSPIIQLLYMRGAFDEHSLLFTQRALWLYAPGLLIFSLAKILVPFFHAHSDTQTPMRIGLIAVGLNLAFNLLFLVLLPDGWKHAGLALGTVISSLLQVLILAALIQKRYQALDPASLGRGLLRSSLLCIPMAGSAWILNHVLETWPLLLRLPLSIGGALILYGLLAILSRSPELRWIRER